MMRIAALAFLLLFGTDCQAANWKAIRRITLAMTCAGMATDAITSLGPRRLELNPLLRNADGRPHMGKIGLVKGAACGGIAVTQELWKHDKAWAGVNIGAAGTLGWATWRNSRR